MRLPTPGNKQSTLALLVQDPKSSFMQFLENHSYYTYEWQNEYARILEYEASSYARGHMPDPLCTSPTMISTEERLIEIYRTYLYSYKPCQ